MLLATLTLTAALAAPAEPQPLRPVEAVQIVAEGVAEPLCRGARLENGRIVAPLLPLVGVKAMKARGADGAEKPILSVTTPNHPWLLVLDTEVPGKSSKPEHGKLEPLVGLTMTMLPGVKIDPPTTFVRVNFECRRPGQNSAATDGRFSRDSLGAVAVSKAGLGLMLIAGPKDAKRLSIFAVLDADSLAAHGRRRPAARWGESTDNAASRDAARALLAGDAAALDAAFSDPKNAPEPPVHRALMPLVVEMLSMSDRTRTVLDLFQRDETLARDPRMRAVKTADLIRSKQHRAVLDGYDAIAERSAMDEYLAGFALEFLRSPRAEDLYRSAIELSPGLHEAWGRLGVLMVQKRDAEMAARCAKECLKFDGTGVGAGWIADAMEGANLHAVAEPVRRAIIDAAPANPAHYAALAKNLLALSRPREALDVVRGCEATGLSSPQLFEQALAAAGGLRNADLVRDRGDLYLAKHPGERASALYAEQWMRLDRAEEALALLEPALKETPASVRLHTGRTWCLLRLARDAEALAEARRVLELKPGDPTALDYAMTAAYQLDDAGPAEEYAEALVKASPKSPKALEVLARLAAKRGDNKKLDAALARLRALVPEYADQLAQTLRPGK